MNKDMIVMQKQELIRYHYVQKYLEGQLKQKEVAEALGISTRQVRRISSRVKEIGVEGVIHQNRGCKVHNKINDFDKKKIIRLYQKYYQGFSMTMFSEKLDSKHGIDVSRETLRQWLLGGKIIKLKRKVKKHRNWRERKKYVGEMIQMDGSQHDWLENGKKIVLMGYVDDANNRVYGRFYEYEGTIPAMDSFRRYVRKYGVPESVYLDCHTTYRAVKKDQQRALYSLEMEEAMSQFERAMKEMGVKVIHAYSPQAKGRVERLFRTLQDRLVKELRLAKAKTIEEANKVLDQYLKEHNEKFMVDPQGVANLHRKIGKGVNLKNMLCIKKEHPLRNDNTVFHEKKIYQVTQSTRAKKIEVRDHVDGSMQIMGNGRSLRYKEIDRAPQKPKKNRLSDRIKVKTKPKGWRFGNLNLGRSNKLTVN